MKQKFNFDEVVKGQSFMSIDDFMDRFHNLYFSDMDSCEVGDSD